MDDIPTLISHDFSEYELYREDILGIGSYGSVYKGKNRRSGATVAMKFFMEDAEAPQVDVPVHCSVPNAGRSRAWCIVARATHMLMWSRTSQRTSCPS